MTEEKLKGSADQADQADQEDQEVQYMTEALFLANSYAQLDETRKTLEKRLAGSWVYTKDMAIADLNNISVSYDGERVQSSNISNPTERTVLKINDERYMARKQAEMDAEKAACVRELEYVSWKAGVVETAVRERMGAELRSMFTLHYKGHKTYRETQRILLKRRGKNAYNDKIYRQKNDCVKMISRELELRSQLGTEEQFMRMLHAEVLEVLKALETDSNSNTQGGSG